MTIDGFLLDSAHYMNKGFYVTKGQRKLLVFHMSHSPLPVNLLEAPKSMGELGRGFYTSVSRISWSLIRQHDYINAYLFDISRYLEDYRVARILNGDIGYRFYQSKYGMVIAYYQSEGLGLVTIDGGNTYRRFTRSIGGQVVFHSEEVYKYLENFYEPVSFDDRIYLEDAIRHSGKLQLCYSLDYRTSLFKEL